MSVEFQANNSKTGRDYEEHVAEWLTERGLAVVAHRHRHESGVQFDLLVKDWEGNEFGVECKTSQHGATQPGMRRSDNRWKVYGYLYLLRMWRDQTGQNVRYLLITSDMPPVGSEQRRVLDQAELVGDIQIIEVPAPTAEAQS
jgi:Holliday junction resolvase-like predicted endonuclease